MTDELRDCMDRMIPGDAARGVPAFSEAAWPDFCALHPEILERARELFAASGTSQDSSLAGDPDEVARSLASFLQRTDREFYARFRNAALGRYFSSPAVLRALGEETKPLFPLGQSLPGFDLELLEGVYHRGSIWRNVKE